MLKRGELDTSHTRLAPLPVVEVTSKSIVAQSKGDNGNKSEGWLPSPELSILTQPTRTLIGANEPGNAKVDSRQPSDMFHSGLEVMIRTDFQPTPQPIQAESANFRASVCHIMTGMANLEHLMILKQGAEAWNKWREKNPETWPDLNKADLTEANLSGANLSRADLVAAFLAETDLSVANLNGGKLIGANLNGAKLSGASLSGADLRRADLIGANLSGASLSGADLTKADLSGADLIGANLSGADLTKADLTKADLSGADLLEARLGRANLFEVCLDLAVLEETGIADVDLSTARGLEYCKHYGPSTIDYRTLLKSGPLPLVFLRGCGLPDNLIEYLPSLLNQPIQFYSCFISYSSKDQKFAERLHADLQDKGVRCWFAPEDLKIGAELRSTFDEAIRLRDKLLILLSADSIQSGWVQREAEQALDEEKRRRKAGRKDCQVLFPVRLDDVIFDIETGWATDVKRRHIGDFRCWKDHDSYQKAFKRLLRDLKMETSDGVVV